MRCCSPRSTEQATREIHGPLAWRMGGGLRESEPSRPGLVCAVALLDPRYSTNRTPLQSVRAGAGQMAPAARLSPPDHPGRARAGGGLLSAPTGAGGWKIPSIPGWGRGTWFGVPPHGGGDHMKPSHRTSPQPPLHTHVGPDELFEFPDGIASRVTSPSGTTMAVSGPIPEPIKARRRWPRSHQSPRYPHPRYPRRQLPRHGWRRLLEAAPAVRGRLPGRLLKGQHAQAGEDIWAQGQTAAAFLAQEETEVLADVRDLVVPGCISIMAAPLLRQEHCRPLSGARAGAGGLFRDERVRQRRVALVDRDNPPALVRKRLPLARRPRGHWGSRCSPATKRRR